MKSLTYFLIICTVFLPITLSHVSNSIVKDYLIPETGKWLFPHNDDETNSTETPGTVNAPNTEIVEEMLSGFSQQVNTDTPAGVDTCLDDMSAMTINQFFYSIINKLANSDFMSIPLRTEGFKDTIDPTVLQCLQDNQQLQDLLDKYEVGDMSLNTFYSKLSNYTYEGNYQELVDQASNIRSAYENLDYKNAGLLTGQLLQAIIGFQPKFHSLLKNPLMMYYGSFTYLATLFNSRTKPVNSVFHPSVKFEDCLDDIEGLSNGNHKNHLMYMFNGVFTEVGLDEKDAYSFVFSCFNEDDAKLMLDSVAQFLTQIAGRDLYNVPQTIDKLNQNLSNRALKCFKSRHEFGKLVGKYGLKGKDVQYVLNRIDIHGQRKGYDALGDLANNIKGEIKNSGMQVAGEHLGKALKMVLKE